ncbi:MAG TPA: hypothetical protein VHF26_12270, partial [Trebonia sp.]|nr:hypothetical protein [Trebonia sp.]
GPSDAHLPESGMPGWYARRALLRAAVFGAHDRQAWPRHPAVATSVATGVVTEVREDAIVLASDRGTEFFDVSPATVAWLGAPATPSALRAGDPVVLRHRPSDTGIPGRRCAERIWSRIGRVTGIIAAAEGREFLVDTGDRSPRRVVVSAAASKQIQVRFPRLAPGYLLDVIGTRHGDYLLAVTPATAQPPYRAGQVPAPPRGGGPVRARIGGSAVWHEPGDEPAGLLGLGYPALDREAGALAADARFADGGAGCVRLPYLSLGATVWIRNECTDRAAVLPVTSDGAMARQFCDRCLDCGTSPKGRVADLTMAAFVELGGNLEDGCFNAVVSASPGLPDTAPGQLTGSNWVDTGGYA